MSKVSPLEIEGLRLLDSTLNKDNRGQLAKILENSNSSTGTSFGDINSLLIANNTHAGTIRGMHFQAHPFVEKKFVACLRGKILDVVVDLRCGSNTYGCWAAIELSDETLNSLVLPEGVAHGYQTLTSNTSIIYAVTPEYSLENSYSLRFDDKSVGIDWPLLVSQISKRDEHGISLDQATKLINSL